MSTPDPEIEITLGLAQRLLDDQHPDLARLVLTIAGEGWDNVMIRLGNDLAMRLPRRCLASELVSNEQRWLPLIQLSSPIRLPVPIRVGSATSYYPYAWSVVPWFPGGRATTDPLAASQIAPFAAFLRALHVDAPHNAPRNTFRSQPLTAYGAAVEQRLSRVEATGVDLGVDVTTIRNLWRDLEATAIDQEPTWIHGDLHPNNVVTDSGALVSVIDWGDMTKGDVSTDLSSVWSLFEPMCHDDFWAAYGPVTQATRNRARAWAIHFALLWIVDASDVDSTFDTMGRRTLARVVS
ncbi:MAG: phosphotransferase [Proteobacteria bacterium]|nr:phosphotransferase [Pseudomonadota bacterium]